MMEGLRSVCSSGDLFIVAKLGILDSIVVSMVLYGFESWVVNVMEKRARSVRYLR